MKAGLEETESESEPQEVSKEETAVETIGALEDQYGDRYLAVGRHRQPKKRTQGDGGSRKNLAAPRRQVTSLAVPAPLNGRDHEGLAAEKRRRKGPECNNDLRDKVLNA